MEKFEMGYGNATVEVLETPELAHGEIVEQDEIGCVWVRKNIFSIRWCRGGYEYCVSGGGQGWSPEKNVRNLSISSSI